MDTPPDDEMRRRDPDNPSYDPKFPEVPEDPRNPNDRVDGDQLPSDRWVDPDKWKIDEEGERAADRYLI
jgi:hypothetical protein